MPRKPSFSVRFYGDKNECPRYEILAKKFYELANKVNGSRPFRWNRKIQNGVEIECIKLANSFAILKIYVPGGGCPLLPEGIVIGLYATADNAPCFYHLYDPATGLFSIGVDPVVSVVRPATDGLDWRSGISVLEDANYMAMPKLYNVEYEHADIVNPNDRLRGTLQCSGENHLTLSGSLSLIARNGKWRVPTVHYRGRKFFNDRYVTSIWKYYDEVLKDYSHLLNVSGTVDVERHNKKIAVFQAEIRTDCNGTGDFNIVSGVVADNKWDCVKDVNAHGKDAKNSRLLTTINAPNVRYTPLFTDTEYVDFRDHERCLLATPNTIKTKPSFYIALFSFLGKETEYYGYSYAEHRRYSDLMKAVSQDGQTFYKVLTAPKLLQRLSYLHSSHGTQPIMRHDADWGEQLLIKGTYIPPATELDGGFVLTEIVTHKTCNKEAMFIAPHPDYNVYNEIENYDFETCTYSYDSNEWFRSTMRPHFAYQVTVDYCPLREYDEVYYPQWGFRSEYQTSVGASWASGKEVAYESEVIVNLWMKPNDELQVVKKFQRFAANGATNSLATIASSTQIMGSPFENIHIETVLEANGTQLFDPSYIDISESRSYSDPCAIDDGGGGVPYFSDEAIERVGFPAFSSATPYFANGGFNETVNSNGVTIEPIIWDFKRNRQVYRKTTWHWNRTKNNTEDGTCDGYWKEEIIVEDSSGTTVIHSMTASQTKDYVEEVSHANEETRPTSFRNMTLVNVDICGNGLFGHCCNGDPYFVAPEHEALVPAGLPKEDYYAVARHSCSITNANYVFNAFHTAIGSEAFCSHKNPAVYGLGSYNEYEYWVYALNVNHSDVVAQPDVRFFAINDQVNALTNADQSSHTMSVGDMSELGRMKNGLKECPGGMAYAAYGDDYILFIDRMKFFNTSASLTDSVISYGSPPTHVQGNSNSNTPDEYLFILNGSRKDLEAEGEALGLPTDSREISCLLASSDSFL